MNRLYRYIALALIALGFGNGTAWAQTDPGKQRTIAVTGESSEDVMPDRAILSVAVVSKNRELAAAKKENDGLVQKLVGITGQLGIAKDKVATSQISIAPQYNYVDGEQRFIGYTVSRNFRVTMDSAELHEKLMSALVDAKIDQVDGIEFMLSNPKAHEAALRLSAFADAKAKAEALAQAAGGKLGPALTIILGENAASPPRPMAMMAMRAKAEPSVAPALPGLVTLHETVAVTFALE